jgi:hypothetical protein
VLYCVVVIHVCRCDARVMVVPVLWPVDVLSLAVSPGQSVHS